MITSVTKFILDSLRNQIITSKLKGGEKLNESSVSSELGISRPPLREAFRTLEQEHLIASIPRRGVYVTKLSTDNYEKVHETRQMIECHVIELLKAKNIRDLPEVKRVLKNVCKSPLPEASPEEKLGFIQSIDDFHIKLVDSVENEFLQHFYGIIRFNITRYSFLYLLESGAAEYFVDQHGQILNLIENGQFDEAKDYLRIHMNESWERMRQRLLTSDNPITEKSPA